MPLSPVGRKILASFRKQYGPKGEGYFYASERKGKITPKAFAGGKKRKRAKSKRRKK